MTQRPQKRPQKRGLKADIKGPLIIAAVLAVVAFFGVFVFATGGTDNTPAIRLALSAAGGVFIVTLVVCATLIIVEKPNDEQLGQGTGVNRRSVDLYAAAKARREEQAQASSGTGSSGAGSSAAGSGSGAGESAGSGQGGQPGQNGMGGQSRAGRSVVGPDEEDAPRYGQRAHPEDHNPTC